MSAKVVNTLNQLKVLILCGISVLLIQAGQAITKGGEMVNTSIETTPIQDGDKFELILKEGY